MKNNTPKIYFTLTNTKKHRSVLAILALIFSLLLPAFAVTELPKDTNAITELTPDQAQKLVQEFPGVNIFLKTDLAEVEANGCLPLNGLKSLDSKVAQALAGFEKGPLLLNGLTTLTPESAHARSRPVGRTATANCVPSAGKGRSSQCFPMNELIRP